MAKKSGESSEQKRAVKRAKAVQISQSEALSLAIKSLMRPTPSKFAPYVMRRRTNVAEPKISHTADINEPKKNTWHIPTVSVTSVNLC
jgi:hypothetical protein